MIRPIVAKMVGLLLIMGATWFAFAQNSSLRLVPAEPLAANPVSLPEAVEFHIVTGYEADVADGRSAVTILVDRPDAAVALVLTSHDAILWRLEATPGTSISAVFVDSHRRHPHVEMALDVPVRQLNLPNYFHPEDARFGDLLRILEQHFRLDRVASVYSEYRLADRVIIDRVEANAPHFETDWPRPTAADPTVRFSLLADDGLAMQYDRTRLCGHQMAGAPISSRTMPW